MATKRKKLLFAGAVYYPWGGMDDLWHEGTADECKDYFVANAKQIHERGGAGYIENWAQIVDKLTLKIELIGNLKEDKHGVINVEWKENGH